MNRNILFIFVLLLISSCASVNRADQNRLHKMIEMHDYKGAIDYTQNDSFLSDPKNELLRSLEQSRVQFLNKNYYQALLGFDKSKEIASNLFTISVSKKVATTFSNDNADNFYGDNYEISLIRFYQALCHFQLFLNGKYESYKTIIDKKEIVVPEKVLNPEEVRFHLQAAKSVLLEWDSYLTSLKSTTGGVVTFKDDLLAKLLGAFIHEHTGDNHDIQIARDLYKASKILIFRNYNIYKSLNKKFLDFRKEFSNFSKMDEDLVSKKYVDKTENYNDLISFIDDRLNALKNKNDENCLLVIEEGLIQEKIAKVYDIPLSNGGIGLYGAVGGDSNFLRFSIRILGFSGNTIPRIYYELPELPLKEMSSNYELKVVSMDGKFQKKIKVINVAPLNEIANQSLDEKISSISTKTGVRVAGKHLSALLASYTLYNSQKEKLGDLFAMGAAILSYQAANRAIQLSESADLRSWQTLPDSIRFGRIKLPVGIYKIILEQGEKEIELSTFQINTETRPQLIHLIR
jgi:hypothetical protein